MKYNSRINGFTLIELLVVIAIIGILTAVLLVNLVGIRERGADTKKKSDLNQLKNSLRLYYNDYQAYPDGNGTGSLMGCGADGISACVGDPDNASFPSTLQNASGTVYMKEVPEYVDYNVDANNETYYIGVSLSNASDPDAATSHSRCGVTDTEANVGVFYVCTD